MAKTKISEYSATAGNNTDINSINLAEGMAPSLVNNAIRQLMAQLKDFQVGTAGDNVTVGGNLAVTGTSTLTGAITATGGVSGAVTSSSATITGGTITGITDLAIADGGTGASTATAALNNLLPSQTSNANKYLQTDGTNATWDAVSLSTADITGTLAVANGGTGVTSSTGTGNVVLSNSPTLVTPALGTPASGVATNLTGTASGLTAGNVTTNANLTGAVTSVGNATSLGSFSSANLLGALTDETGTGSAVFATSPTLVTPILGTPTSATLTNATGLPIATGVSGLGTGVATALAVNVGSSGAPLVNGGVLGTPSSGTATNLTGLPISTGVSGLGTGVATALAVNVGSAGAAIVNGGVLGTPSGGTATNLTGLPLSTGVTGTLPIANGGSGQTTATAAFNALAPSQTSNSGKYLTTDGTNSSWATVSGGSGTVTSVAVSGGTTGLTTSGGPVTTSGTITLSGTLAVANGGTGTATPSIVAGTNVTVTGTWPNQTIAASGSGGGVAYTAVKTANYTAANNDGVLTDTTGGAFTVTLPTTPSVGNIVIVIDSLSQWGTNNLTVDPTASIKIAGNTAGDTLVCDITGATVTLIYTGATYGWNVAAQVGGNGGTAVTLTGTQTLTNKTLTTPTLTTPVASTTIGVGGATASASGAGITFPATQSASSNANTLDDYEEGNWTPTQGGGLTVVGTFTSFGRYTKIGDLVYIQGYLQSTTSLAFSANALIIGGLPFSASTTYSDLINGANGANTAVASSVTSSTNLYSAESLAATNLYYFSGTCKLA